jgi:hypothetical protein
MSGRHAASEILPSHRIVGRNGVEWDRKVVKCASDVCSLRSGKTFRRL